VVGLVLAVVWIVRLQTSAQPRQEGQLTQVLTPLPSEHDSSMDVGNPHNSQASFQALMLPNTASDKFVSSQYCQTVVSLAKMLGMVSQRHKAARAILGKKLNQTEFVKLKESIVKAEKATALAQAVQWQQCKTGKNILGSVVPTLKSLTETMTKRERDNSGWHGFRRLRVADSRVNFVDQIKEHFNEISSSKDSSLQFTNVVKLYDESEDFMKQAMGELPDTLQDGVTASSAAKVKVTKAAEVAAQDDKEEIQALRADSLARANLKAYDETQEVQGGMKACIDAAISQKTADLASREADLKSFTFRMWGWRVGMWENDVALAKEKVAQIKAELNTLEARLIQHTENEMKTRGPGGALANAKSEQTHASANLVAARAKALTSRAKVQTAEKALISETDRLLMRAKEANLESYEQLVMVKKMHFTLANDVVAVVGMVKMDDDPFKLVKTQVEFVLELAQHAEFVCEQRQAVEDFVKLAGGSWAEGEQPVAWKQLVLFYGSVDVACFNNLTLFGAVDCSGKQSITME